MKLLLILFVAGTAFAESPEENVGEPGLFEGDIILTPTQRFAIDMGLAIDGSLSRGSSSISYFHWPNGVVPYTFDPTISHALGFYHEQSRPDRDTYVKINFENIKDGYAGNFKKQKTSTINSFGTPYDYGSVMHYGTNYFSKNGKPTIEVKKAGATIGQRRGPSATDVKQMNLLYKCKNTGGGGGTTPTKAPIATTAPCVDLHTSCASYIKYCSSGHSFIIKYCRKTCNLC